MRSEDPTPKGVCSHWFDLTLITSILAAVFSCIDDLMAFY